MSPVDARLALLCAELERDWAGVQEQLRRARDVDPTESGPHAAWVALALDHAYQGFETILVRAERALGLPAREGSRWHLDVLEQASLDIPGLRPALVPTEAIPAWTELLKFRHFLRHAYGADLDPSRLADNVTRLADAVQRTDPSLTEVLAALRES